MKPIQAFFPEIWLLSIYQHTSGAGHAEGCGRGFWAFPEGEICKENLRNILKEIKDGTK